MFFFYSKNQNCLEEIKMYKSEKTANIRLTQCEKRIKNRQTLTKLLTKLKYVSQFYSF